MSETARTADIPTIVVEVLGGVVTEVKTDDSLKHPLRVLVRDYDNLKVDPETEDDEYVLIQNS